MNKIKLMPFQEDAITRLAETFKKLWVSGNDGANVVFKAPTGSGKTIMMAQFLKDISNDPLFDVDKCFVWISFGGDDSYTQSKDKLFNFYDGAGEVNLLDLTDLSKKKMINNEIFFINWAKLKAGNKEGRVLRAETENTMQGIDGGIFDEFIINTKAEGREIILIVDESHLETGTGLSEEVVKLIAPKLEIHVSATPKKEPSASDLINNRAGYIEVSHDEVIKAGLIKEKVITQTEEDIKQITSDNVDDALIDLAIAKREELKSFYSELNVENINPLVLVQIPNKNKKDNLDDEEERQSIIKDYLLSKGIQEHEIAVWLSDRKENLEDIVKDNSEVSFLIFKQAVATGWDCPRAHILIMYREIKNPAFHIQTVGRILRMPEAKHYSISSLNQGYLYTNYKKNEIHTEKEGSLGANSLADIFAFRKEGLEPIKLNSIHLKRIDYNDLKPSYEFEAHLEEIFNKYFDIKEPFTMYEENIKRIEEKGLKFETSKPSLDIMVDAEIENYDNLAEEIKESNEMGLPVSEYDIQRMYDKLCYDVIRKQEKEEAKFASERSWSILKSALNVWIMEKITEDREKAYNIIVNDLLKEGSCLKRVLEEAFVSYRPKANKFLEKQNERKKDIVEVEIPVAIEEYTKDYEEIKAEKSALQPFYNRKEYKGKVNEEAFIKYMEAKDNIDWFYKSGDSGMNYFSVPYNNNKSLFYPDWFIKLKNGKLLIVDTKSGFTAKEDAKMKIEALHKYLKDNKLDYIAGIVIKQSDIWKVNTNETYNYEDDFSEFINLDDIIDL